MQQDMLETIIKRTAKETIAEIRKADNKERRSKVFHNTKILMENYSRIKESVDSGISSLKDLENEKMNIDIDEDMDELFVESIRRGKVRSAVIIAHIDRCLEMLKVEQDKKGIPEKYRALKMHYIDGMDYQELSGKLNCSERTARRWANEMLGQLGVYLFGADALV